MTTEGKEVAVKGLHIKGEVRGSLGCIHEYGDAVFVGLSDQFAYRIHGSEYVGDVGTAEQSCPFGEQRREYLKVEAPFIGDGTHLYFYTRARL